MLISQLKFSAIIFSSNSKLVPYIRFALFSFGAVSGRLVTAYMSSNLTQKCKGRDRIKSQIVWDFIRTVHKGFGGQ